jgi:hypothetical protein
MKPAQQSKGTAEKKPRATDTQLMGSAATTQTTVEAASARPAFGSPSAAMWSRYIDSRM